MHLRPSFLAFLDFLHYYQTLQFQDKSHYLEPSVLHEIACFDPSIIPPSSCSLLLWLFYEPFMKENKGNTFQKYNAIRMHTNGIVIKTIMIKAQLIRLFEHVVCFLLLGIRLNDHHQSLLMLLLHHGEQEGNVRK